MASVEHATALTLTELNELPEAEVSQVLAGCCTARHWISAIVSGRSYPSVDALLGRADLAVAELTPAQLAEALVGHPRIGDRKAASAPGWSRQEQAGVSVADADLARELAQGNADYERRFGHIYLVCATGKSGGELLAILRERLGNERDTEWKVVAAELAKINRLRLRKLLGTQG
jgi:2-oxo-4-hydroxy-4-carboxy-5-ureidoimidazoline decarboxylase